MHMIDHAIDFVFCVDKTSRVILKYLNDIIQKIAIMQLDDMEREDDNKRVSDLRVKIIAYGDLSTSPFEETGFYDYFKEAEREKVKEYCQSIKPEFLGNGRTVDGLEAVARAISSEWTTKGVGRRYVIIMLNENDCSELGAHKSGKYYPDNMPVDFPQLTAWWEGTDGNFKGLYHSRYGRMITLTPKKKPWNKFLIWGRCWVEFWDFKGRINQQEIISVINGEF